MEKFTCKICNHGSYSTKTNLNKHIRNNFCFFKKVANQLIKKENQVRKLMNKKRNTNKNLVFFDELIKELENFQIMLKNYKKKKLFIVKNN